ncbi:MAG: hypothetical protein GYB31_01730 [Bacteroidetes bacterium]|nr:hypothetical protein [Bacteroidota bacterium]
MSQTKETAHHFHVRPRFQVESDQSVDDIAANIKSALQREGATCKGRIKHGFATLWIPHEEQHYWSPQLTLTLEKTEEGTSLLRGVYGPRPSVWTMFIFFYSVIGFAMMVISIVGFSNVSLDKSGKILWLLPVLFVIFLSLYLVAYFGQKLGQKQMVVLHLFVEKSTGFVIDPRQDLMVDPEEVLKKKP